MATKPSIKLDMQSNQMIRQLGKRGNRLQVVAAETVNETAEKLDDRYVSNLKRNQKLRAERYTLGAIKIFKANPIRRSGEPRQLSRINSIVGVRKMKGGEEHYLAKLESGSRRRGNPKTKSRVPIPLQASRTSGSDLKPIAGANRLSKGNTQTLRVRGQVIGVKRDGYKTNRNRWGALYGAKKTGTIQGDPKKPFFFIDNSGDLGIFKFARNTAKKIRTLKYSTTKTKAKPNFQKAVKATTPAEIKSTFVKKAQKEMGKLK